MNKNLVCICGRQKSRHPTKGGSCASWENLSAERHMLRQILVNACTFFLSVAGKGMPEPQSQHYCNAVFFQSHSSSTSMLKNPSSPNFFGAPVGLACSSSHADHPIGGFCHVLLHCKCTALLRGVLWHHPAGGWRCSGPRWVNPLRIVTARTCVWSYSPFFL